MYKISKREMNLRKTLHEKKMKSFLAQEEQFQKQLKKDYRVKQIDQFLENKRNELIDHMNEKEKRVEEFMEHKNNMAQKKLDAFSEINKEKQLNNSIKC